MNDTYFFGKRMNLNQGGRVNFNQGGPGFYNQADRELYAGGLQYLPQEQYRLGLGTNTNQPNNYIENIKKDLSKHKKITTLFDSKKYTKNLEDIYINLLKNN